MRHGVHSQNDNETNDICSLWNIKSASLTFPHPRRTSTGQRHHGTFMSLHHKIGVRPSVNTIMSVQGLWFQTNLIIQHTHRVDVCKHAIFQRGRVVGHELVLCHVYIDGLVQEDVTLLLTHWSNVFLSSMWYSIQLQINKTQVRSYTFSHTHI